MVTTSQPWPGACDSPVPFLFTGKRHSTVLITGLLRVGSCSGRFGMEEVSTAAACLSQFAHQSLTDCALLVLTCSLSLTICLVNTLYVNSPWNSGKCPLPSFCSEHFFQEAHFYPPSLSGAYSIWRGSCDLTNGSLLPPEHILVLSVSAWSLSLFLWLHWAWGDSHPPFCPACSSKSKLSTTGDSRCHFTP